MLFVVAATLRDVEQDCLMYWEFGLEDPRFEVPPDCWEHVGYDIDRRGLRHLSLATREQLWELEFRGRRSLKKALTAMAAKAEHLRSIVRRNSSFLIAFLSRLLASIVGMINEVNSDVWLPRVIAPGGKSTDYLSLC